MLMLSILAVSSFSSFGRDRFRFVFMTDIHVQPERRGTEGVIKAISAVNDLKPEFVITGGDLIMDALGKPFGRADSLYALYTTLIQRFGMPVYNCIGNHDIFGLYPRSGTDPSHPEYGKKMFLNRLGYDRTYQSFDFGNWHFILLDGIGITPENQYDGEIDGEQLAWLRGDLEKTGKNRPVAMAVHMPLFSAYIQFLEGSMTPNSKTLVVQNGKEVWDLCEPYNVKLVLQGHLHVVEEISWKGTRFVTGGAVCASWWKGIHEGFEEGFVVVDVSGNDFSWRYEDYGWEVQ